MKPGRERWVQLGAFALLQGVVQLNWITFAPVTGSAAVFYRVDVSRIGLLSTTYMIVYLGIGPLSSWFLNRFGLRPGLALAAALTAGFGLLRGFAGASYPIVLAATVGVAVAQPFVLNSITQFAARWFAERQRATAVGITVMAQSLGMVIGLRATPWLAAAHGLPGALRIYAWATAAAGALFLLVLHHRAALTAGPAAAGEPQRAPASGLRQMARRPAVLLILLSFFVGAGIYNALLTWIEQILAPRGFGAELAGRAGGLMMACGVFGAALLPAWSDRIGKRRWPLLVAIAGSVPGIAGLAFAGAPAAVLAAAALYGFCAMGAGPIVFQYTAELAHPAPEATSQGVLVLISQLSGILFVYALDALRSTSGAMTPFLVVMIALALGNLVLVSRLPEARWR